jgi:hypothetical protein
MALLLRISGFEPCLVEVHSKALPLEDIEAGASRIIDPPTMPTTGCPLQSPNESSKLNALGVLPGEIEQGTRQTKTAFLLL